MATVTASELEHILSRHDPMGLLTSGTASGVYLPEAEIAAPRLAHVACASDVRRVLTNAFTGWMGPSFTPSPESLTPPSQEVWAALSAG